MYYGEGAGTRRKLISATVDAKTRLNPAYGRAFHQELARQDMAEHAEKARKERRRKDTSHALSQNAKGLATGNYQGVQTGVLVAVVVGYFAHQSGLDRKAYIKAKDFAKKSKARIKARFSTI